MKPTKAVSTCIIHDDIMKAFNIHRKYRSSHPEVFLEKGVPKICNKFTGENPRRSVTSIHFSAWVFTCKFAAYFQKTFN